MGSGASTITAVHTFSPEDVANLVSGFGSNYKQYERTVIEKRISGELLLSLREKDIEGLLNLVGVEIQHQRILAAYMKTLVARKNDELKEADNDDAHFSHFSSAVPADDDTKNSLPLSACQVMGHVMLISDYAGGGYAGGYICDLCTKQGTGWRWLCRPCSCDICLNCRPLQPLHDVACVFHERRHAMEVCVGDVYGKKQCDECERKDLQNDPMYYCCLVADNYLCIGCASQRHVELEAIKNVCGWKSMK